MFGARDSITVHIQVTEFRAIRIGDGRSSNDHAKFARGKVPSDDDDGASIESQDAFITIYKNALRGIYFATFVSRDNFACCRRHRGHEHHVGIRDRADERDRTSKSCRCPSSGHFAAISDRIG
jgi:hypothetical protein